MGWSWHFVISKWETIVVISLQMAREIGDWLGIPIQIIADFCSALFISLPHLNTTLVRIPCSHHLAKRSSRRHQGSRFVACDTIDFNEQLAANDCKCARISQRISKKLVGFYIAYGRWWLEVSIAKKSHHPIGSVYLGYIPVRRCVLGK